MGIQNESPFDENYVPQVSNVHNIISLNDSQIIKKTTI